jgi:hypothetical protein
MFSPPSYFFPLSLGYIFFNPSHFYLLPILSLNNLKFWKFGNNLEIFNPFFFLITYDFLFIFVKFVNFVDIFLVLLLLVLYSQWNSLMGTKIWEHYKIFWFSWLGILIKKTLYMVFLPPCPSWPKCHFGLIDLDLTIYFWLVYFIEPPWQ